MSKPKSKSNAHHPGRPGPGYLEGLPKRSPAPTRSSDPKIQNSISPGVRYEGDAASQASPSGDNPPFRTRGDEGPAVPTRRKSR